MSTAYSVAIPAVLAAYVFATLPLTEKFVVLVIGLLFASIFLNPRMRDFGFKVLGAVNRRVLNVLAKRVDYSDFRAKAIQTCVAIDRYPAYMKSVLNRKKRLFFMLDKVQQNEAMAAYQAILEAERCSNINYEALTKLKMHTMESFNLSQRDLWGHDTNAYDAVEVIEHLVRDWSDSKHHGKARDRLFEPFWPHLSHRYRVLVPGSGLGRLPFEISRRLPGDAVVDALELSPAMYAASLYATSRPSEQSLTLYPYLLEFSHLKRRADQFQPATVELPQKEDSEKAQFHFHDFLTFDRGYKYDAVVTLFFIDTAQNIFRYIDKISEVLAPGGIWLNQGPLKWGTAAFVEFSLDELFSYLRKSGWVIEDQWTGTNRYNGSEDSMLKTEYKVIGWAARRA